MPKTITSTELLPLLESKRGDLLDCTTGLIRAFKLPTARKAQKLGPEHFDFDLAGSGTLVSAAGVRAILTADHVLSKMPESDPFGLVVLSRTGRGTRKIIESGIGRIPIAARGKDESKGPDLGLFVLSPTDANDLEAQGKVFYNLDKRRSRFLHSPPPLEKGCAWILCGMVGEWTKEIAPDSRFARAKKIRGTCGPLVFAGHREEGEFDYLSIEVSYDGGYTGPANYAGCSGGSLWQALLKVRNNSVVIDELLLAGVLFYQSPNENNRRIIECHGRRSVYEVAVEALEGVAAA